MRHLIGLLIGIVLTLAIVAGTGWAVPRLSGLADSGETFLSVGALTTLTGLGLLALLVGLAMALPRLSPLVPGVAALGLLGWSGLYVFREGMATGYLPAQEWAQGSLRLLELGLYGPLAVALLVPLFLPSRWAPPELEEGDVEEDYLEDLHEEDHEEDPQDYDEPEQPRGRRYAGRRRAAR